MSEKPPTLQEVVTWREHVADCQAILDAREARLRTAFDCERAGHAGESVPRVQKLVEEAVAELEEGKKILAEMREARRKDPTGLSSILARRTGN